MSKIQPRDWSKYKALTLAAVKNKVKNDIATLYRQKEFKEVIDSLVEDINTALEDTFEQIPSDWNQADPEAKDYIKNKPDLDIYAEKEDLAPVAISGDYDDLSNKPELAKVATSGSYNDLSDKPVIPAAQVNSDWNANSGVAEILNKPVLANVATSGDYTDLINTPHIPEDQVQSDWTQDNTTKKDYIKHKPDLDIYAKEEDLAAVAKSGSYEDLEDTPNLSAVATSGDYDDLSNKPTIPTKTSDLTNDSGFITDVSWDDVKSKPTFATVATSGSYNDLSDTPNLAQVAKSGSYNDLEDKPTIPAAQVNSDWNAVSGVAQILNKPTLATVATSGSYTDLSNTPTIPVVPTNVSAFTNDAGYITSLVDNLVNYYKKSETYTKDEVNQIVANFGSFEVVEELPVEDIKTNVIYLVPKEDTAVENIYDEYIYIRKELVGNWELIGSTEIDLSNYATLDNLNDETTRAIVAETAIKSDIENSALMEKEVEALPLSDISDKTIYKLTSGDINYLYTKAIVYTDNTKTEVAQEVNGNFAFNFENYEKDNIQYYHIAWGWPWESSDSVYIKIEDLNYDTNNDIIAYFMDDGELVPSTTENSYIRLYTTPPTNFLNDYTEQALQNYQTWLNTAGKPVNTGRFIYLDNTWVDFDKLIDKQALNTNNQQILNQIANNYIMLELETAPSSTPITGTLTSEQLATLNRQTKIIFKFPRLDLFRNVLSFSMEIIDNNDNINYLFSVISWDGSRWDFNVKPSSGEWSLTNEYDYQQKLVSGTSIKTINNESLLGSGDIQTFIPNIITLQQVSGPTSIPSSAIGKIDEWTIIRVPQSNDIDYLCHSDRKKTSDNQNVLEFSCQYLDPINLIIGRFIVNIDLENEQYFTNSQTVTVPTYTDGDEELL